MVIVNLPMARGRAGIAFMTIRELAKLSGVSAATVSLALRNHARISQTTKDHVLRLAQRHGYVIDGRISELMGAVRLHRAGEPKGCLGLISLYADARPWEDPARGHLRRIHDGQVERANELGYRLEEFWVNQPGVSADRLAAIIAARGIQGLLSLGAPELEDEMPAPLRKFVIVTQGTSIRTRLHRVVSHFSQNTDFLLTTLKTRGYRRPGAVLQRFQDGRNWHQVSGLYLYHAKYTFADLDLPIFYATDAPEPVAFDRWFRTYRPDVLIYGEQRRYHAPIAAYLQKRGLRVPRDVGLALLESAVHPASLSGVGQNFEQCGRKSVDVLISNLHHRRHGESVTPSVVCLDGDWVEGKTLRPPP